MKLPTLKSLIKICRKHIFSILLGLLSIIKKDSKVICILSIIISLFSFNILDNDCSKNINDNESNCSNESDQKWSDMLKQKLNNLNTTNNVDNNKVDSWLNKEEDLEFKEFKKKNGVNNDFENTNIEKNISTEIKKKSSKIINKVIDKNNNKKWYKDSKEQILKNYKDNIMDDFVLNVTDENRHLLICNLRTYPNIDFYFKLYITDYGNKKLNQLIMLRDIQNWMCNSNITNEEFENIAIPIYLILKDHKSDNEIMTFEVFRLYIYEKEQNKKQCFVAKGDQYLAVEEILDILFKNNYIQNLCNDKNYDSYNLCDNNELCSFLDKLLSGCTLNTSNKDDKVYLDMHHIVDNKETFDYLYNTLNSNDMIKGIEKNEVIDTINEPINLDNFNISEPEYKEDLNKILDDSFKNRVIPKTNLVDLLTTI